MIGDYYYGTGRRKTSVARVFLKRGSGKIVVVASDAGRVGSLGETVYSGAKGGVIAFTKGLAREMARHNITANCVCPGPTDTALFRDFAGHDPKIEPLLEKRGLTTQ